MAAVKPQDPFVAKALALGTGLKIELRLGLAADIEAALERYSQTDEEDLDRGFGGFDVSDDEFVEHLRDLASEAPVIQRVNQIIQRALDIEASDIHLEYFDDGLRYRYRIDGVLQEASQVVMTACRPPLSPGSNCWRTSTSLSVDCRKMVES